MRAPDPDADIPLVSIPGASSARRWLEAAAQQLAVRWQLVDDVAAPIPDDGPCRVVHAVRSAHGQVVTYALAVEHWRSGELDSVNVDLADPDAATQRAAVEWMRDSQAIGAVAIRFTANDAVQGALGAGAAAAWTLDGCLTPLYENHVRALLDLPLGSPRLLGGAVASARVAYAPGMHAALRHCFARDPQLRVHLYGTPAVSGMTIGHVTVVADDADDAQRRALHAAQYLTGLIEE